MFHISDAGVIYLNRGDSMKTSLCLNCGTALVPIQYILKDEDTVYFALMEPNTTFETAIVKKVFTNKDELTEQGDLYIKLSPKDTENLLPGKYYYTIKLKTDLSDDDYEVQTVVPETEFQLLR